jgi:hypothetical protein
MIPLLLALLQAPAQGQAPTVGDTIWLERSVTVPPGAEVRAAPWDPEGDIALLGKPVIRREGNTATIAYPAVAWTAGSHTIEVPGPILIGHDGRTDSLPAEPRVIEVASILPAGQSPDKLAVQPEVGVVAERITSPWPPLLALLGAALLFAPVAWWWRRRGPAMVPARPVREVVPLPLEEWTEAGEERAVATVAAHALRGTITGLLPGASSGLVTSRLMRIIEEQRPKWPTAELGQMLQELDAVQYADSGSAQVVALAARAEALRRQLEAVP